MAVNGRANGFPLTGTGSGRRSDGDDDAAAVVVVAVAVKVLPATPELADEVRRPPLRTCRDDDGGDGCGTAAAESSAGSGRS